MKVTITDYTLRVDDAPPVGIDGLTPKDCEIIANIQTITWVMSRLSEELGMLVARDGAAQAIETARGKA